MTSIKQAGLQFSQDFPVLGQPKVLQLIVSDSFQTIIWG